MPPLPKRSCLPGAGVSRPPSPNKPFPPLLFHLCQLWPTYIIALGRETQRFHLHLLTFSLLQPFQEQNASTQPAGWAPGPNLCVKALCCRSSQSCWSSKNISKYIWIYESLGPQLQYVGHRKVGPVPLVGKNISWESVPWEKNLTLCVFGDLMQMKKTRDALTII